ncbi:MAG TPA: protein kinase [Candidatus Dormibacteraeota bacterium]|nr:protein kinase [Candidatus Dormibacteraeota bacterium]
MLGHRLGPYLILEQIGQGGMGIVYRARDERLERDVALKVLPPNSLADDSARRHFRKEALALARLNHTNVAAVYEFDRDGNNDFIVMEFVSGSTLAELIAHAHGALPEKQVLDLGRQLAEGLAAAHAQGVIHRDLKPSNIRVTPQGHLKILDFGIAMIFRPGAADDTVTATQAQSGLIGTLSYMAPEQLRGELADVRTDIFAAGILLYEMCTGCRPFVGTQTTRLLEAILGPPPAPPSSLNGKVSPALENIILKSLDKEPDRRFQSARELSVDLERCAQPTSFYSAAPVRLPLWKRIGRAARAHPLTSAFSGLATAALLVLAWWIFGARPVLSFAPRDFVLIADFDNQTGDTVFDRSLLTALSVSVEQSAHVNVLPPARVAESLKRMAKNAGDKIDESTGRQICLREDLKALLVPSISRAGQQYALSARLINPQSGVSAWSDIETARSQDEILPALGRLASRIRRGLGESWLTTRKQDRPLPLVTTTSLPALKMFADGQDLWRRGQYHQGVQLWQSALQADPDFAMVHAALGGAMYSYIYNDPLGGKEHFEKALQLSDRTTDRERLLIRAEFASSQNHFPDALQLLQEYLQEYPDDTNMRLSLAHLLRGNDRCDAAIEQYKEVLRVDPRSAASLIDIATCNAQLGNLPQALQYYEQAFQVEPSWKVSGVINHEYGMALTRAGQEDKARELFTSVSANPDMHGRALRSLAYLDLYHGHYRAAKAAFQEALIQDQVHKAALSIAREHCLLALVYEGIGDNTSRVRELNEAMQIYPSLADKVFSGLWLVRGYARAGQTEKAVQVLEAMKKQADPNNTTQASLVNFSEAEVEMVRGARAHAIELLLLAEHQHHNAWVLDGLGRAYEAAGDTEQAARWSKAFADMGALGYEPQQDWFGSLVRLARLSLARGYKDDARAALEKLFALWKDPDPNLPLLREAQRIQKQLVQ